MKSTMSSLMVPTRRENSAERSAGGSAAAGAPADVVLHAASAAHSIDAAAGQNRLTRERLWPSARSAPNLAGVRRGVIPSVVRRARSRRAHEELAAVWERHVAPVGALERVILGAVTV